MHIDIVSDVVCPWCFIGKRRLEKALAMRPEIEVEITWRPFQLNPDVPPEGVDRQAYLAAKFGGGANTERIHATLADAGATVDILFAFDRIRRTPNTCAAHRLLRYAGTQGRAGVMAEALFRAYFIDGRDIGDQAVLTAIAGEVGLDTAKAGAFLASGAEIEHVLAEERGARRLGINAVPCFIFERHYAVSGAQEPEFFLPVFDLVLNGSQASC